jgi:GDA1/CD39 (nucleoside phosphatase) family.
MEQTLHDDRHPSLRIEAKHSWELHNRRLATDTGRLLRSHHKKKRHEKKKREKKLKKLYDDSGIKVGTMHGMMIDAGSSGSRMHVYEFEPRVLHGQRETSLAVAGKKLSYPGTDSRWTDRLRPGIANFASLSDDELFPVSIV